METKELISAVETNEYRERESLDGSNNCTVCGVELFRHENNLCDYCREMLLAELEEEDY